MNIAIKHWAEDDRPREKLLLKGSAALSNAELLAIIINNGTKDESAIAVAQKVLAAVHNRLDDLAKMSVKQLLNLKVKGIGPAKAIAIAAALELGMRREIDFKRKECINTGADAAEYLQAKLQYLKHEVFVVMFLDAGRHILHEETISQGGLNGTHIDERLIVKRALEYNATQLVLCHNHPGGTLEPSDADRHTTQKIAAAGALFDISILDHLIVTDADFFSFAREGIL